MSPLSSQPTHTRLFRYLLFFSRLVSFLLHIRERSILPLPVGFKLRNYYTFIYFDLLLCRLLNSKGKEKNETKIEKSDRQQSEMLLKRKIGEKKSMQGDSLLTMSLPSFYFLFFHNFCFFFSFIPFHSGFKRLLFVKVGRFCQHTKDIAPKLNEIIRIDNGVREKRLFGCFVNCAATDSLSR